MERIETAEVLPLILQGGVPDVVGAQVEPRPAHPLVVGLDLSLTGTGVAAADGTLRTIRSATTDDTVHLRVGRITDIALTILKLIPEDTALIVIEGPAYGQQAQAGVHLRAGLWWHIAYTLTRWRPDAHLIEASPSTVKKLATGKGNATKPDMRMALFQRAGVDCRDDNQVDAFWLRQIGLQLLEAPDRLTLPATHMAALAKVHNRPLPAAAAEPF